MKALSFFVSRGGEGGSKTSLIYLYCNERTGLYPKLQSWAGVCVGGASPAGAEKPCPSASRLVRTKPKRLRRGRRPRRPVLSLLPRPALFAQNPSVFVGDDVHGVPFDPYSDSNSSAVLQSSSAASQPVASAMRVYPPPLPGNRVMHPVLR